MAGGDQGAALVPLALVRLAALGWRILVVIALAISVAYLLVVLSTVTASVFVAVVIAATFSPYVASFRARGWSRTKAAAVVTVGALLVIIVIVGLVGFAFLPYLVDIATAIAAGLGAFTDLLENGNLPRELTAILDQLASIIKSDVTAVVASIAGAAATLVTIAILAGILTFFLMLDGDKAWVWALSSRSTWRQEAITSSGRLALERVGGYLRRSGVQSAIDAITAFVFLTVLGVPLAGPFAVLVFLGGFIPYFGGVVTTGVLALATLAAAGTTAAVAFVIAVSLVNIFQRQYVDPRIRGEALDIHPALLLIVLPLGWALGGLVGLFVSVPVLAFVLAAGGALVTVLDVEPGARQPASAVPVWLDRLAQWSWRLLVALGLLAVLVAAAIRIPQVVVPVVLAIIAASTLHPADAILRRRGWSASRSAITVTLGAGVAIAAILALTLISLAGPVSDIVGSALDGAGKADGSWTGSLGSLIEVVKTVGTSLIGAVGEVVHATVGLTILLAISALLTFFFIRDGSTLWQRLTRPLSKTRRDHLDEAGDDAVSVLGGYMIGTGAISLFGAVTQFAIMFILGIPLALPLAILSFFGGFIPYIGSFVTTGLAFLVTVSTGDTTDIVVMGIFTIVFNIVQGNVVAPIVYGRAVNLHPAIVLMAIPAGAAIAGVAGMFLVVPFLGVVKTTWGSLLQALDDDSAVGPSDVAADSASAKEVPEAERDPVAAPGEPSTA